ncbi:DUF4912 domain-containing protein [Microcoleus sp. FACHB-1515]|uniref:DUF4912 domain-containing protein n=1 Tax=Microcoleus sp. FACHB-1515 TaxID=2692821 RepID=UPI001687A305|nr:DUF4912 domain-containing protein [Microcoleus sp. FACHB-1515]
MKALGGWAIEPDAIQDTAIWALKYERSPLDKNQDGTLFVAILRLKLKPCAKALYETVFCRSIRVAPCVEFPTMVSKKDASVVLLALLVALSAAPRSAEGQNAALSTSPVFASAPSSFPLPSAVPSGTTVRVDGSDSMSAINQSLKQAFEQQYTGTTVNLAATGTDAALRSLLAEEIDLAAVGRSLTPQEKAQGLVETILSREKIAMIVGADNPFAKGLTSEQFARIFRGEITNWSQVGGENLPIRFLDRPDSSDTRSALGNYPVFQSAPFQTGRTATQLDQDSTAAIVDQLGRDGISYALVSQVQNLPNVRILPMHNTPPTDPRYPFSQPRGYVYQQSASPAVAAFLGFAGSAAGQAAIAAANTAETASGAVTASPTDTAAGGAIAPTDTATAPATSETTAAAPAEAAPPPTGLATDTATQTTGLPGWLWLLPLILLGGGLWWLLRQRRQTEADPPPVVRSTTPPPTPPPAPIPAVDDSPSLAARTESIIASDRAARSPLANEPDASSPAAIDPPPPAVNPLGAAALAGGAIFGAGAIADAMHEADEETEPVLDVTPDSDVSGDAWADAPGENFNTVPLAASDDRLVDSAVPEAIADDPLVPPAVEPIAADLAADSVEMESTEVPIDPVIAASLTNAIAATEEPNVAAAPETAELDAANFAAVELPEEPLIAPEIPPAIADEAIAASEPEILEPSGDAATLAAVSGLGAVAAANLANQSAEPLEAIEPVEAIEEEAILLDPLPIESVGDVDELTLAPEPIIDSIDPVAPEPDIVLISTADQVAIDPPAEPESELTLDETAMLDAIEDEVEALPLPEEVAASESEPSIDLSEQMILAGGAALAMGGMRMVGGDREQSAIEAARFDVGTTEDDALDLSAVDADLPDLPEGYGESRIVLMPRDPQWAYAYWDVPNDHKAALRSQGGTRLAVRLYDVTDLDLATQRPHSLQQYECDELARDWYLAVPVSDRDYIAEIGYVTEDGRWLMLARSAPVRIPPVYPSDWFEDQFLTIEWEEDLQGKTFLELIPPEQKAARAVSSPVYSQIFDLAQSIEMQRIAGSLFGSMQQVPQSVISSFIFPSGVGQWAAPFELLPLPTPSGMGMSGIGMSGVGFSASMPPIRPRQFWLVADAELIVYGATEPDATVTIGGRPIKLNPDGTFRFQMSFQDGLIDFPIMAVAADGEQTRSIHMEFTRETPERNTNTKDEAIDEWP